MTHGVTHCPFSSFRLSFRGCILVPAALDQSIENETIGIDGSP